MTLEQVLVDPLVGHLTGTLPLFHELESASNWLASTGSGSAKWMAPSVSALATSLASAAPLEGCGVRVPGARRGLQPFDQFCRAGRRLTGQCAASNDALDRL